MFVVGLVIERDRIKPETDALRWYCKNDPDKILYEKWFFCEDLGKQLVPVVQVCNF